ncbi:hypothetical protein [Frondihabitans cladoniiphilus]|uniref:FtsK-like protein n=1 Tax=Frondihabitans cladoniiphilus TaxID=715785 RepID=A0ABP8VR71_9MICO
MGIISALARRRGRATTSPAEHPISVEVIIEAARLVVSTRFATARLLEQRLGVTAHEAAALLARLEHCEVVAPFDGSATRRVLTTSQQLPGVIAEFRSRG